MFYPRPSPISNVSHPRTIKLRTVMCNRAGEGLRTEANNNINVQLCLHNEIHHIIIIFITLHHPGDIGLSYCRGISLKANLDIPPNFLNLLSHFKIFSFPWDYPRVSAAAWDRPHPSMRTESHSIFACNFTLEGHSCCILLHVYNIIKLSKFLHAFCTSKYIISPSGKGQSHICWNGATRSFQTGILLLL